MRIVRITHQVIIIMTLTIDTRGIDTQAIVTLGSGTSIFIFTDGTRIPLIPGNKKKIGIRMSCRPSTFPLTTFMTSPRFLCQTQSL